MFGLVLGAGQGGCLALEDAVVLARALRKVAGGSGAGVGGGSLRSATTTAVAEALRGFERERSVRAARIAAQSWLFGFVLQMPFAPVCLPSATVICAVHFWLSWLVRLLYCPRTDAVASC